MNGFRKLLAASLSALLLLALWPASALATVTLSVEASQGAYTADTTTSLAPVVTADDAKQPVEGYTNDSGVTLLVKSVEGTSSQVATVTNGSEKFTATATAETVAANGNISVVIKPRDGLAPGEHTATIEVSCEEAEVAEKMVVTYKLTVLPKISVTGPDTETKAIEAIAGLDVNAMKTASIGATDYPGLITVTANMAGNPHVKYTLSDTTNFDLYGSTSATAISGADPLAGTNLTNVVLTTGTPVYIWVVPESTAAAGTYTPTVTVTEVNADSTPKEGAFTSAAIPVSVELSAATAELAVTLKGLTGNTFAAQLTGGDAPVAADIQVANPGNTAVKIEKIALAKTAGTPFVLANDTFSTPVTVAAGASAIDLQPSGSTATVQPKGTILNTVANHQDTLVVTYTIGSDTVKKTLEVPISFEVQEAAYSVSLADVQITSQTIVATDTKTTPAQGTAVALDFTDNGTAAATIDSVKLVGDGAKYFVLTGTDHGTVSAVESGSLKVQLADGIGELIDASKAGVYTATIEAEYNGGKKATATVRFAVVAEGDATLASLKVAGYSISPSFSSGTTSYTVTVPEDLPNINVNPVANDSRATFTVNGASLSNPLTLTDGENKLDIVVTAANSDKKTYTLTVKRGTPSSGSGGSSFGSSGSNGSWPGDNYPPAPPPPAEILPGTPGTATPTTPSATNPFSFRVLARSLNVRSGPGTSFAKVGTLKANDIVSVVGYSADGTWAQLSTGSWVSLAYVSQVVSVDVGDYIVTVKSGSLNVRSGPGTSSAKIGSLANNALVMVTSVTGGWAQIEYNGGVGYVSVLYLR